MRDAARTGPRLPTNSASPETAKSGDIHVGSSPAGVPSFWDYALAFESLRTDSFGTFIRLVGRRTLARPREIASADELQAILLREGVHIAASASAQLWQGFCRHQLPKLESSHAG